MRSGRGAVSWVVRPITDQATSAMVVGIAGLLLLLGGAAASAAYAIEPLNLSFTVWEGGVSKLATAAALTALRVAFLVVGKF